MTIKGAMGGVKTPYQQPTMRGPVAPSRAQLASKRQLLNKKRLLNRKQAHPEAPPYRPI